MRSLPHSPTSHRTCCNMVRVCLCRVQWLQQVCCAALCCAVLGACGRATRAKDWLRAPQCVLVCGCLVFTWPSSTGRFELTEDELTNPPSFGMLVCMGFRLPPSCIHASNVCVFLTCVLPLIALQSPTQALELELELELELVLLRPIIAPWPLLRHHRRYPWPLPAMVLHLPCTPQSLHICPHQQTAGPCWTLPRSC